MIYGITGALGREILGIKELMQVEREEVVAGRTYYFGKINETDVVLVISKIGKVAAAQAVTTMIQMFHCEKIVFIGMAGAADTALEIGDFVIAKAMAQHDIDLSDIGDPKYEVPGLEKTYFEVAREDVLWGASAAKKYIAEKYGTEIDPALAKSLHMGIPSVHTGTIASGDQFIGDRKVVKGLFSEIRDLKCIEMESGAAAQVCFENHIPILAVRIISDRADEHAELDFLLFAEKIAGIMIKGFVACLFSESI